MGLGTGPEGLGKELLKGFGGSRVVAPGGAALMKPSAAGARRLEKGRGVSWLERD